MHAVPPAPAAAAAHAPHAAEQVRTLVELAQRNGIGHARMALRPAELGGVEIRLRTSSAGLVAHVRAETAATAQVLHDAASELRRTLEDRGVHVLRLDVEWSGDAAAQAGAHGSRQERHAAADRGSPTGAAGTGPGAAGNGEAAEPTVRHSIEIGGGLVVDVLA
jgi:flagellar hook-length control protein FliK